jgi:hypothetical protein
VLRPRCAAGSPTRSARPARPSASRLGRCATAATPSEPATCLNSLKDKVYARYGITTHTAATYEVDHLIPLELGGSNSIKNLFPEAASPRPGFHEKDKLENRLHSLVCGGKMKLRTAQRQIAKNWLTSYGRFFG